jgi:hypothetical protein
MTPTGLPHSEISGSTPACDSPELFAANHVLHRLLTPRHSPCALSSLVTNFPWNPGRLHTSDARSGRQSLPSLGHRCETPVWDPHIIGISLLSLSRYAVYKVEIVRNERSRSPLTLDCFVRRSCVPSKRCTQDTLSRRRCYLLFRELVPRSLGPAAKAVNPIGTHPFRQGSCWPHELGRVERKGFEPSTPGLQSRCSPS